MESKRLVPVSMDFLYDGMVTPHDIYNSDASILLLSQGNFLRMSQIEAIRSINNGLDTIRVTLETKKLLLEHNLSCKLIDKEVLEKETGYDGIKDETAGILNEITQNQTLATDKLNAVSENLSWRLEVVSPDKLADLINALAPVGEYLQRHCVNVSLLNGLIAKWIGLPKHHVDLLVLTGFAHDCGKASIPAAILNAPRRLSVAEFDIIRSHPFYGYDMLAGFPEPVRAGTLGHHEKFNGKGYPVGLSSRDIPLEARITAVSDIYDAMVSSRTYKGPRSPFHVFAHLKNLRITELDPQIVDIFLKHMPAELLNKPVVLSDGEIGAIHEIDYDDLEYPVVRTGNKVIKTNEKLCCESMYFEEK
jgi:HD-GYP domain-containing protein (c-di-GMP phosphodiesterase class II)